MKHFKLITSLLALGFLCGCATSHTNTEFIPHLKVDGKEPAAVIVAENYGYYLFGFIPLIAGNPDNANATSLTVFKDTVTIENNHRMILAAADELNTPYTLTNMRDSTDWTGAFSLWIIWKQVLNSNTVAIKAPATANDATPSGSKNSEVGAPVDSH